MPFRATSTEVNHLVACPAEYYYIQQYAFAALGRVFPNVRREEIMLFLDPIDMGVRVAFRGCHVLIGRIELKEKFMPIVMAGMVQIFEQEKT